MFEIHQVLENQRVALAVAYLHDEGDVWFQGWSRVRGNYNWDDFTRGLNERFKERGQLDVVQEFNRLTQEG